MCHFKIPLFYKEGNLKASYIKAAILSLAFSNVKKKTDEKAIQIIHILYTNGVEFLETS